MNGSVPNGVEGGGDGAQIKGAVGGVIYHETNRRDRREPIFLDDRDRECFLETLGETCRKTVWQVHAYCLIPNHFHLAIETTWGQRRRGQRKLVYGQCAAG